MNFSLLCQVLFNYLHTVFNQLQVFLFSQGKAHFKGKEYLSIKFYLATTQIMNMNWTDHRLSGDRRHNSRNFTFPRGGREGELEHGTAINWELTRLNIAGLKASPLLNSTKWIKCIAMLSAVHLIILSAFILKCPFANNRSVQFKFMICAVARYLYIELLHCWMYCISVSRAVA